jgi:hypothetical protein
MMLSYIWTEKLCKFQSYRSENSDRVPFATEKNAIRT